MTPEQRESAIYALAGAIRACHPQWRTYRGGHPRAGQSRVRDHLADACELLGLEAPSEFGPGVEFERVRAVLGSALHDLTTGDVAGAHAGVFVACAIAREAA